MTSKEKVVANQLTEIFTQAARLLRDRGLDNSVQFEMPAMDLLMDHNLTLGPPGLAAVLLILAKEDGPVTRAHVATAVNQYFEAGFGLN